MITRQNLLAIVGTLSLAFLSAVDGTIVGTAMPTVIAAVGGLELYPWVASAFMLASTVSTPLFGKLADLFGAKRLMFVAIALFLIGSALCGAAQTMPQLIGFRALQGVGAAGVLTTSLIAFGLLVSPENRTKAQALMSSVWGIASLTGPALGGLIVDTLGWRWAFYVNLPIGLLSAAIIAVGMPAFAGSWSTGGSTKRTIDWQGAALFTAGMPAVLYGLMEGSRHGGLAWAIGLGGLLLLIGFLWHERRAPEPLMVLSLFQNRVIAISVALNFLAASTLFASTALIPMLAQGVLGTTALGAGAVIAPMMLGWTIGTYTCGFLAPRLGEQRVIAGGALLMLAGLSGFALSPEVPALGTISALMGLMGLGMGNLATATLAMVQNTVEMQHFGAATSAVQFFRMVGGAMGLSLLGGIQLRAMQTDLAARLRTPELAALAEEARRLIAHPEALMSPQAALSASPEALGLVREALAHSLHGAYAVGAFVGAVAVGLSLLMPAREAPFPGGVQSERVTDDRQPTETSSA